MATKGLVKLGWTVRVASSMSELSPYVSSRMTMMNGTEKHLEWRDTIRMLGLQSSRRTKIWLMVCSTYGVQNLYQG